MKRPATRPFLKSILRDVRGVSAIEFAFIAPILIVLYFGMAEVTSALMAARKSSHAVSTVGNLVAQTPQLSTSTMANMFQGADDVMTPYPTSGALLKLRAFSVSVRSDNSMKVDWACVPNGQSDQTLTLLTVNQTIVSSSGAPAAVTGLSSSQVTAIQTLLTGSSMVGQSVVVSQGIYTFNSVVTSFLNSIASYIAPATMTFSNTSYFKPRQSAIVGTPGTLSNQCSG